jgi:hypothetical protein
MKQMTIKTLRILPNAKFLPLDKCDTGQLEIRMWRIHTDQVVNPTKIWPPFMVSLEYFSWDLERSVSKPYSYHHGNLNPAIFKENQKKIPRDMKNWHTGISNKAYKRLTDAWMQSIEG